MFSTKIFQSKYYKDLVLKYISDSLENDLYPNGDITTEAIFGNNKKIATAKIIAKESGIIAGLEEIELFLRSVIPEPHRESSKPKFLNKNSQFSVLSSQFFFNDGDKIKKGETILEITSDIKTLLKIERTILNLLQRMSGIATETFKIVSKVKNIKIAATRKTPLGLIDKKAVILGGGIPHRLNLSDAILIKDTHLDPFGRENLDKAIEKVIANISPLPRGDVPVFGTEGLCLEIEVLTESEAVLAAETFQKISSTQYPVPSTFIIMLDNFSPAKIKETIKVLNKKNIQHGILLEASGGINAKNIKNYDIKGLDFVSLGYLTHSAKALDISMKISK